MIRCTQVTVKKMRNEVLKNISLVVPSGRITCLLGSSGAGKTTLLRAIAQLDNDYEGSIIIDGCENASLTPQQLSSRLGFVFQQFHLFGCRSVIENCMLALQLVKGFCPQKARAVATDILDKLGIVALADRLPAQISGGQQQRVAIARALCLNPGNLLLDEPTSALDPVNATVLALLLKDLARQGIAIALASQDSAFICMVLDRAYVLENGEIIEEYDADLAGFMPPNLKSFLK